MLTETKVFGEKYIVREDAKHSDLLHPSLSGGGGVSPSCSPLFFAFPIFSPIYALSWPGHLAEDPFLPAGVKGRWSATGIFPPQGAFKKKKKKVTRVLTSCFKCNCPLKDDVYKNKFRSFAR